MSEIQVIDIGPSSDPVVDAPIIETPVAEAPAPVPQSEPERAADDGMAARFAALSKKEKQVIDRERQLKDTYETKVAAWETAQQSAKTNPIAYLESIGLTLEDVANHVLSDTGTQPLSPEQLRVKQIEDKLDAMQAAKEADKLAAEQEQMRSVQQYQEQVISTFRAQIVEHLTNNADTYELTANLDSVDLVFDVVEQYHMQTGEILPLDVAIQSVEEYWEGEVERVMLLKKPSAKYGRSAVETPTEESSAERSVTLTNRVGQTTTPRVEVTQPTAGNFDQFIEDSKQKAAEFLERELAKSNR